MPVLAEFRPPLSSPRVCYDTLEPGPSTLPPWGPNGVGEVAGTLHWVAMTFPVRMLGGSAVPLGESVGYV